MITQKEILSKINELINNEFPNHAVYIQVCPNDFLRPAFLLEYIKTLTTDINCSTVKKTISIKITCFTPLDSNNKPDMNELVVLQEETYELLSSGYVNIGDRAIKVLSSTGSVDSEKAFLDIQFEFFETRSNDVSMPLMATIKTNIQED